jgi:trans-aconitate methyltransferase
MNPWLSTRHMGGDAYDAGYEERAAAGQDVHGEADFVERLGARTVLDAGCGTGRVARELGRRGLETVGVDLDPEMLETARRKAPHLEWHLADLATIQLGRTFEAVVAAGNVMIFLTPGSEELVLRNLAHHLTPGGALVAGFQLTSGRMSLEHYDQVAEAAGLTLEARYATWDRQPWQRDGDYAVSVHRRTKVNRTGQD